MSESRLEFAFLCDYAALDQKLHAMGIGIDTLYAAGAPFRHPVFYLVAQLRLDLTEPVDVAVTGRVISADGAELQHATIGRLSMPAAPADAPDGDGLVRVVAGVRDVTFPAFGDYSLELSLADEVIATFPIKARQRDDQHATEGRPPARRRRARSLAESKETAASNADV